MLQAICIYILIGLAVLGILVIAYGWCYLCSDGDFIAGMIGFAFIVIIMFLFLGATGNLYCFIDFLKDIWIKYNI